MKKTERRSFASRRKTLRRGGGRKKIAVCFWGLTRSLKYTLSSIQSVIQSLREVGDVTVFLHTYAVRSTYTNERAREKDIRLDPDEWKALNPEYHEVEDQDEVKKSIDFSAYRSSGDPWDNNYATLDNFILAMRSLNKVTDLMMKHSFTHVVFMRPDVKFVDGLNTSLLDKVKRNVCIVPKFHSWGGVNDRFAICSQRVAKVYGTRVTGLLEYSKMRRPHSETYLRDTLAAHNVHVLKVPICFHRIRATGEEFPDC